MQKRIRCTKKNMYFALGTILLQVILCGLAIKMPVINFGAIGVSLFFLNLLLFSRWLYPTKKTFWSFIFYPLFIPSVLFFLFSITRNGGHPNEGLFFILLPIIILLGDLLIRVLFQKILAIKKETSFWTKEIKIKNWLFLLLETPVVIGSVIGFYFLVVFLNRIFS